MAKRETTEVTQEWYGTRSDIDAISKPRATLKKYGSSDDEGNVAELEKEIQRLRNSALSSGAKMAEMETNVHELKLQLDEERNKNAKLELEIKRLKRAEEQKKDADCSQIEGISGTIEMLSDLMDKQSEDITVLSLQRERLVGIIRKLEASNQAFEDIVSEQNGAIKEMEKRINEVENQYEAMVAKSERQMDGLWGRISYVVPEGMVDEIDGDNSEEKIMELVKVLGSQRDRPVAHVDRSRELEILGHFENALRFIKKLALPDAESDEKAFVLGQCARMTKLLEQHCANDALPNVVSLFEKRNCEEQMRAVFDFVDISKENETPTRELLALFTATIYINGILFTQLDHASQVGRSAEREQELIIENERLNGLLADEGAQHDLMMERIHAYVKTPSDDVFSALEALLSQYEQMEADLAEAAEANQELNGRIEHMKTVVATYPANEREMTAQKKKIRKLTEKNEMLFTEIERLKSSNDELSTRYDKLVASMEKSKSKAQKDKQALQEKYYVTLTEQSQAAESQVKSISAENMKLKQVVEELNAQQARLLSERDAFVKQQQENEKRSQTRILDLVRRIEELENVNNDTLMSLKTRGDDLREKYELRVESLTDELADARKTIDDLLSQVSEMKASKQEQQLSIAKLKLNERTLNLKIKQLTDQARVKESVIETRASAKISAMKTEFDAELKREQEMLERYSTKIIALMERAFNIHIENAPVESVLDSFESIVDQRSTMQWKQLTDDAIAIRKIMGLKKGDSLLDAFQRNQRLYEDTTQRNSRLEKQNRQLASENALMKRTQKNNEDSSAWMKWATGLYYQITEGSIPAFSSEDIKYALEEALLSSIGHRTLRRRLEILRSEKRMLVSCRSLLTDNYRVTPVQSIRPLTLVAMFSRRMQSMAGCLARQYRSTGRSTAASSVCSFKP